MALRLDSGVKGIEIDNRRRDRVKGRLWLAGRDLPIELLLAGNCLRDIAGYRVILERNGAEPEKSADMLAGTQTGIAGDITASRKVKVPACSPLEACHLEEKGKHIPLRTENCLYMEWFSEANGRVVVESTAFRVKEMSAGEWRMTASDEEAQLDRNREALREWIGRFLPSSEFMEMDEDEWHEDDDYPVEEDDEPMDEFEWKKSLEESDALTEKFSALFEKYAGNPEREKLIVREMGWEWLDDALDAEERGVIEKDEEYIEETAHPEPNPVTEGVDWIRTKRGRITHPLTNRAFHVAMAMWHSCRNRGLLGPGGDRDLRDMIFEAQTLSAKLAGALDHLAYDTGPEGGFVVASLKRALRYLERSLALSRVVAEKKILASEELRKFQTDLFGLRETMLELMDRFRNRIS
ncbi:MAG: hypothetical protein R6V03_10830 [Kiritimatiellia bacterium]